MTGTIILLFIVFWLAGYVTSRILYYRQEVKRAKRIEALKRHLIMQAEIKRQQMYGHSFTDDI